MGPPKHPRGIQIPSQALEFGIITPILMVIKKAQGSDMAKVIRPKGGRVRLNLGPTSKPVFYP